jgi:3',5'-cyclic AMP phosphodiesterase CpdA
MIRSPVLTRRQLLRLSARTLLAAGLWPGAVGAEDRAGAEDFSFLVVNDTHWKDWQGGDWFAGLAKQLKGHAEKPELLLLAGDLSEDGKPEQLSPMRDFCKGLGLPVHVVIGNHDFLKPNARKPYEDLFPDRLNYRFEHRGWQFVAFDSTEGPRYKDTLIQPETLKWLDDTLPKLDRKRPLIVVTHFPLGPGVKMAPGNAADVLERFKGHNLRAVFSGHFHSSTERQVGDVVLTTNWCCSFASANHDGHKGKGYFLCRARAGTVTRTFVEYQYPPG